MTKAAEQNRARNCRTVSSVLAWSAILIGLAVLSGWWLRIPVPTSIISGYATMQPNTAACFLLAGVALWFSRLGPESEALPPARRWIAGSCAGIVLFVGLASLVENLSDLDLGIDLLLVPSSVLAASAARPGLMAGAASVGMVFISTAILLIDFKLRGRWPAQAMSLGAGLIGFLGLLGYVYRVDMLATSGYASVALHTAALLLLLGIGGLCARPGRGLVAELMSRNLGGHLGRRLLPVFIFLPVLLGWLRLAGDRAGAYGLEFGTALVASIYIVILTLVVWICTGWMNRADAARRRAEERDEELAAMVDSSSDAIIGKTLEGMITSWNKGAERMYGFTEEEVLGKHISLLAPPSLAQDIPFFLDAIRNDKAIAGFETMRRRKDGAMIHVALTISPVRDRDGRIVAASTVAHDITDRKRTEERLAHSQARLEGIIGSAMDAVITVDESQKIVMFNPAAETMFGFTEKEMVGGPLEKLIPHRLRNAHQNHVAEFGQSGTTKRSMGALGALSGLRRDGVEFPIEASISQVQIGGKKLFTAIVRDVTARERAELALRETKEQLRLFVEHAPAAIAMFDAQMNYIAVSNRWSADYGITGNIIGRNHYDIFPDLPERWKQIHRRCLAGDVLRNEADRWERADLSVDWVRWEVRPWRRSDGSIGGVIIFSEVITERKSAEEAIQLAQARLISALEGGRMGTFVWDMEKGQIIWDDATCALFGRGPGEAAGSIDAIIEWLHPLDRERTRASLAVAIRSQPNYDAEYRVIRPNGSMIWVAARGKIERDSQGRPFRMTGVCIDITEGKKIEEQLLQSQKMESLGTLAGGIAHDFNNIVLAIGGNAKLAMEELPPDHPVQGNLREIGKAGARATNLVRQILAFSRRDVPVRKAVNLQAVVEEALALLRATLPARIEIKAGFDALLPAISADSNQLHQVIMNLCTNSVRAIGEGAGILEIAVAAVTVNAEFFARNVRLKEGAYVRLSVSDSGCGMDAATVERIFDPFFTTRPTGQGTGLGLSVVHGIVKDHDGVISVYSELHKGTTFNLYFPAIQQTIIKTEPKAPPARGQGQRLLYVDDEEALVMLCSRTLKRLGYEVLGETDARRALRLFRDAPERFDAVITDLSMPGMSGSELARELLALRRDVPIVMMSGYLRPQDEEDARRLGIRELILKPDTIDDLALALHRVFSQTDADLAGRKPVSQ